MTYIVKCRTHLSNQGWGQIPPHLSLLTNNDEDAISAMNDLGPQMPWDAIEIRMERPGKVLYNESAMPLRVKVGDLIIKITAENTQMGRVSSIRHDTVWFESPGGHLGYVLIEHCTTPHAIQYKDTTIVDLRSNDVFT